MHYIVKVTKTEVQNINWLLGYRDAYWYTKDIGIGCSATNIAKQAIACHTFMASQTCIAWNGQIVACSSCAA